jgi:hypothetical protein
MLFPYEYLVLLGLFWLLAVAVVVDVLAAVVVLVA